ncbi:hypothetical protein YB2330_004001 [Saitoella coloradoensis]
MHSHHSHSGDYCLHAKGHLEDVVKEAIRQGFKLFCMTEHMPRDQQMDLYPEESHLTPQDLEDTFAKYYPHAKLLQKKYASQIEILVGFEIDYIRPSSLALIQRIRDQYPPEVIMGSVHHAYEIPIDFSREMWERCLERAGGSEERLFERYFDDQYEMLRAVKPTVVGHFDLIRLFAPDCGVGLEQYPGVWAKIERNVDLIVEMGAMVEFNSAAFRKGWDEAYPRRDVCELMMRKGVKFCLSDDSHGPHHVGLNYWRTMEYVRELGLEKICYLGKDGEGEVEVREMAVEEVWQDPFWALNAKEKRAA